MRRGLGAGEASIEKGLKDSSTDIGSCCVWKVGGKAGEFFFINGFAANEPESTMLLLERATAHLSFSGSVHVLLCLRRDRGDRSKQWLDFLREKRRFFRRLFIAGSHAHIFKRCIETEVISHADPEKAVTDISSVVKQNDVVLGCGNIHSFGEDIIRYLDGKDRSRYA